MQSKTALDQQGISHKLATNESFVQRHGRETKASLETIFKRQDEMYAWMTQQDNETRQVRAKVQERHDALERWLEEHDNRLNRIGVSGAGSQAPDSAGGRPEIVEVISEARKYANKARGYASDAEGHATTSSTCQQLAQAALHDVNRVATAVSATKEAMETEMETAKAGLQGMEKEAHGQALLRLQAAEGMVQRAEQALVSSKATRPAADASDFAQETSKRLTTIEDTMKRAERLYAGLLDMHKKSDEDRDQHKDTCRTRYETNAADVSSLQQLYRDLLDRTMKARKGVQPQSCHSYPIPEYPFASVAMDFCDMGSHSVESGGVTYDNLFVVVCRLTGYVMAVPCSKTITAPQLAELYLDRVVGVMRHPHEILSDHDHIITKEFFTTLREFSGVQQKQSLVYRPRSNGRAERAVQVVLDSLRKFFAETGRKNWVQLLPLAL